MTIAASTPRQHSPLAEGLLPHRTHSCRPLESEGHAENPQIDQQLSTEADPINGSAASAISFGPFRLLAAKQLLLNADKPVRLGSGALEILIALVERPGKLVSKDELMARVGPNTFVEPANLTVHIAALRRTLGDGRGCNRFLINIPAQSASAHAGGAWRAPRGVTP